MSERIEPSEILEALAQNAQKGQRYRLKMKGDPLVYEGIPLTKPGDTSQDADAFRIDVSAPRERAGLFHGRIRDIEWIEPL